MTNINDSRFNKKKKIFFYKNGYVKINNIFDINYIKSLKKETAKFKRKDHTQLIQIHLYSKIVKKLFQNNKLKEILKSLLGYKFILGLQSERFFNPPGTKGLAPHQDDFFIKSGKYNSANLWIPLQNVKKNNGSLYFFEKSNKEGIDKKYNLTSLNNNNIKTEKYKKYKKKTVSCRLGSAILISNRVFHGSYKNTSNLNREVLVLGYIKKGSKFNTGKTAKRKPFKI